MNLIARLRCYLRDARSHKSCAHNQRLAPRRSSYSRSGMPANRLTIFFLASTSYCVVIAIASMMGEPPP